MEVCQDWGHRAALKRELALLVADQFCRGFKYAGTCAVCGCPIPAGAAGYYTTGPPPHKNTEVCCACKPAPVEDSVEQPDPFSQPPVRKPPARHPQEAAIDRMAKVNALRAQVNAAAGTAPAYQDIPVSFAAYPDDEEESHFAKDSEY